MMKLHTYILLSFVISVCTSYKILVVFPYPIKSHIILGNGYVYHLLKAGHEITYITPSPWTNPPKNLTIVDVSSIHLPNATMNIKDFMHKENDISSHRGVFNLLLFLSKEILNQETVIALLNDSSQYFDVIVAEWLYSQLLSSFAAVYKCPYIWSLSTEPYAHILSLVDEATNPAYTPDIFSTNAVPFTFLQRVVELWNQIYTFFLINFVYLKEEKRIYEGVIGPILAQKGRALPPYEDLVYDASFVLGNSHPSTGQAMSLPQNFKNIGGYHIPYLSLTPLPEDLKKLMDSAENGFIYFSMGTNLKSKDLPEKIKRDLIKMFGELNTTVIWKFEETLPDLPHNLHIVKWAPQNSLLSHPNCRIFITHGGLLSSTEAIHHGIPIIGIPVFIDQFVNIQRAIDKGLGIKVDLTYSIASDLHVAIQDISNSPRYRQKMKEVSYLYHNRPMTPEKELVYWVEHVAATGGASYLRSNAINVPWYQKCYLDLAILIICFVALILFSFHKLNVPISTKIVFKHKLH